MTFDDLEFGALIAFALLGALAVMFTVMRLFETLTEAYKEIVSLRKEIKEHEDRKKEIFDKIQEKLKEINDDSGNNN